MKPALLSLILMAATAYGQDRPTGSCYSCLRSDKPQVLLARAEANYAADCHLEAADCFFYYQITAELDSASLYHFIVSQAFSKNSSTSTRNGHRLTPEQALLQDALVLKGKFKSSRGIFWAAAYPYGRIFNTTVETRDPRYELAIIAELEDVLRHWECEGYDCGSAEFRVQMQKVIDACVGRKAYLTKWQERIMRNKGQDSLVTYPPSGGF